MHLVRLLVPLWFSLALLAGDLPKRYALTLDRVLKGGPPQYSDELVLADAIPTPTRRFTEYSGDVSGRYLGALATAAEQSGRALDQLERVANQALKYQQADGHFGAPLSSQGVKESDMALLWGNGRMLIGLLEYYRLSHRADVLSAARRLGDFLVRAGPRMNAEEVRKAYSGNQLAVGYICWTQVIEGLVELHRVTNEAAYRTLAEQVAVNTHRHPAQHSHGLLTSLRGVLELHRLTHEPKWLAQVEQEWQGLVDAGDILIQGAVPEALSPRVERDEGCSEADWLRLNLGLWGLTRKARYLEQAELTLFNEFAFNQFHTGDYGHHTLTPGGYGPGGARAWWCCTLHGLRAFADVVQTVFHTDQGVLFYDLPLEGKGTVEGLTLEADSLLDRRGMMRLEVVKADTQTHTLAVRQPKWARGLRLRLGGTVLNGETKEGYVRLARTWLRGERLSVEYDLLTRQVQAPGDTNRVAFFHGPWLLGVNEQDTPYFFDEPFEANRLVRPAAGEDGAVKFDAALKPGFNAKPFTAPAGYFKCKYLPGGYAMQPQTALLKPIAEHTALRDSTPWVFWFQLAEPQPK